MKPEIHPKYEEITATCSCGNVIKTRSTVCEDIHLEVCSKCHPFYTGKQKVIDSAGRIDRFNRRFKRNQSLFYFQNGDYAARRVSLFSTHPPSQSFGIIGMYGAMGEVVSQRSFKRNACP